MSNQHRATPAQPAQAAAESLAAATDPYATCLLELRARVEALEAAASGLHGKAAERAEPGPAASLVDRVANAAAHGALPCYDKARAAIREVATWLRSEYPNGTAWANLIEEEANR